VVVVLVEVLMAVVAAAVRRANRLFISTRTLILLSVLVVPLEAIS
jgi:hypothetical protein